MSRRIDQLHPKVQEMCRRLVDEAAEKGISIVITQTLRTNEEQEALYAMGRTTAGVPCDKPIGQCEKHPLGLKVTNARAGESFHNYGLAFDFAIVQKSTGKATWDAKVDVDGNKVWDFVDVGILGESVGLSWGGRWNHADNPHFEYSFGLTVWQLKNGEPIPA